MAESAPKTYLKYYYKLMCSCIDDVVAYEYEDHDFGANDLDAGLDWDLDATAEKITLHLLSKGLLEKYAAHPDWRFEEAIHLAALDWFSSYEPVLIRMESANE